MAIFVVDRRYLTSLDNDALARKCARLDALWREKGCPDDEHMPLWMLGAKAALQSELGRRGDQLSLL